MISERHLYIFQKSVKYSSFSCKYLNINDSYSCYLGFITFINLLFLKIPHLGNSARSFFLFFLFFAFLWLSIKWARDWLKTIVCNPEIKYNNDLKNMVNNSHVDSLCCNRQKFFGKRSLSFWKEVLCATRLPLERRDLWRMNSF